MKRMILMLITVLAGHAMAQPLNFLFILVDDLGCRDLGYEGSTFHETPNIDALAKSGMIFNQGYAACQVCSPSRASLMTGKATPRHGITDWIGAKTGMAWDHDDPVLPSSNGNDLSLEDVTLAEAMREAGYATFFAGKWHLGGKGSWPEDHGFDINVGGWESGSPRRHYFSPYKNPNLDDGPRGESLTLRLAQETASFMKANQDQPFFAYLSFYAVHSQIQTTQVLCRKYQKKAAEQGLADRTQRFKFDRRLPVRQVQDNPIYAGLMETLDDAVGVVLDTLKETGLDQNTVVIFTADNGGVSSGDNFSTSLLPFRGGKGRQWEGGIREPYLIHVPGMTRAGDMSDVPVIGMDFYPTILDLAGWPLKPEQHLDGVSLLPILQGGEIADRDLYWHYPHYGNQGGEPSSIIRSGDWKMIYYHEEGRRELYNLKEDIGEQMDVAAQHPEKVLELQQRLNQWLEETDAQLPAKDPRFKQTAFDERIKTARTSFMQGLEVDHADFLNPAWEPAGKLPWWGSAED